MARLNGKDEDRRARTGKVEQWLPFLCLYRPQMALDARASS
jgi:hypothetical protein